MRASAIFATAKESGGIRDIVRRRQVNVAKDGDLPMFVCVSMACAV
jgi:hypothetical protein